MSFESLRSAVDDRPNSALESHLALLREWSRKDGPLSTTSSYATTNREEWFNAETGKPTYRRSFLWYDITARYRHPSEVSGPPSAVILAGPPGAGKSTIRRSAKWRNWLYVDADEFKTKLLEDAIASRWYETLIPEQLRDMGEDQQFFPLELSGLVHEESSRLATKARGEALYHRHNVVIDMVLGSESKTHDLAYELRGSGYKAIVVQVELTQELSKARVRNRWEKDYKAAMQHVREGSSYQIEMGGRWVPSDVQDSCFSPDKPYSKSYYNALYLANWHDDTGEALVTDLYLYRTESENGSPTLIEYRKRDNPAGELIKLSTID